LEIVSVGQSSGQRFDSRSVLDLHVLDLPSDNVIRFKLEVLMTEMHNLDDTRRGDGKAGL
jgi:hypothetical protein